MDILNSASSYYVTCIYTDENHIANAVTTNFVHSMYHVFHIQNWHNQRYKVRTLVQYMGHFFIIRTNSHRYWPCRISQVTQSISLQNHTRINHFTYTVWCTSSCYMFCRGKYSLNTDNLQVFPKQLRLKIVFVYKILKLKCACAISKDVIGML